jgi:hypothetical protein
MHIRILTFCLLVFFTITQINLKAQETRIKIKNPEASRWVILPYLQPALPFPATGSQVDEFGFRIGIQSFRYSPISIITPGFRFDLTETNFTKLDNKLTKYISREITFVPQVNIKLARRKNPLRNTHVSFNGGAGVVFSAFREKYTDNSPTNDIRQSANDDLRFFRLYLAPGFHFDQDIFYSESQQGRNSRVGLFFVDITVLVPWADLGRYYNPPVADRYAPLIPIISVGQAFDLKRNRENYNFQITKDNFFKIPVSIDRSRRRIYSGLHWEIIMQQPVNNFYTNVLDSSAYRNIRLGFMPEIGYTVHFGNYHKRLNKGGQIEPSTFGYGLMTSVSTSFRKVTLTGTQPGIYQFQTLDLLAGFRLEFPIAEGLTVTGGAWLVRPFNQSYIDKTNTENRSNFIPNDFKLRWFGMVSYRHWMYLKIKPSFLGIYAEKDPIFPERKRSIWERYEISIGTGF